MLLDNHGRTVDYLRIAVTDRCNFRCRYCMPEEGIDFLPKEDLLSYEELRRLGHVFKDLGIKKVRITGGEPFVRKDLKVLLREYSTLFPSINITTNGTLIHHHWPLLEEIALKGLNISIDSLKEGKFNQITRRNDYHLVMNNILTAREKGLPVKLNCVVMKAVNDDEIVDFIEFGQKNDIQVRFIEAMPFNADDGNKSSFLSSTDIIDIIEDEYGDLEKINSETPSSSTKYRNQNLTVPIGVIPAYSRLLCGTCNRIRLTPQGKILTCLYASDGIDLLSIVRQGASDEEIKEWIKSSVKNKEKDGFVEESKRSDKIFQSMTTIGG